MTALPLWIHAGFAAFVWLNFVHFYRKMRAFPPIDRDCLFRIGLGLSGFVFVAFWCFGGVLLIVDLVMLAAMFGVCYRRTAW